MRKLKLPKMPGVRNVRTRKRGLSQTRTVKVRKSKPKFSSVGLRSGTFRRKKSAFSKSAVKAHNTKSMRRLGIKGI